MPYSVSIEDLQNALQSEKKDEKQNYILLVLIFLVGFTIPAIKIVPAFVINAITEAGVTGIIEFLGLPAPFILIRKAKSTKARIQKYKKALEQAPDDMELKKRATDFYFEL